MDIKKELKKFGRDWFNDMVNRETSDAQKKFGFNMTQSAD